MQPPIISASILSADMACLAKEAKAALNAGADWLHIDVMDNHYVPNLTFGPLVCTALRKHLPNTFFDVHLMVKPVGQLIQAFAKAGANQISVHPDASHDTQQTLQQIRERGCKAGLAINPQTSLECLTPVWNELDFILLMSVNPGFAAQTFIPEVLAKISAAKKHIQQQNPSIRLGVDGGIKKENIAKIAAAGADTFVLGSAIFNSNDYVTTLGELRSALNTKGK